MAVYKLYLCSLHIVTVFSLAEAANDEASVYVTDSGDLTFETSTAGGDIRLLPGSGGAVYVNSTQLIATGLSNVNFTDINQSIYYLQQRVGLLEAKNMQLSVNLSTVKASLQSLQQRVTMLEEDNKRLRQANKELHGNLTAITNASEMQLAMAPMGSLQNPAKSCLDLQSIDKYAPSGEYWIQPQGLDKMQVYCEMDIQGGGFTFISTRYVTANSASSGINKLFTNKSSVLFRLVAQNFTQYYSTVEQLDKFKAKKLAVSQNDHTGYTQPVNKAIIGQSGYLFFGVLDSASASVKGAIQGYKSNGIPVNFTNCDANPNSYIVLFPNHDELSPSLYHAGNDMFLRWAKTFTKVQAGLEMPYKYFFFTEMHFGGCGIYISSDRWGDFTASAIGVR